MLNQRYIITGGPGVGKTTLLQALVAKGFPCVPESARDVINEQLKQGSQLVPWIDNPGFSNLVLEKVVQRYLNAPDDQLVFFDRGIADVMAYLILSHKAAPEKYWEAARKHRFNRTVFIAPPWEEIYETDNERLETFEFAVTLHETLVQLYHDLEYDLIELPKTSLEERIKFVLDHVETSNDLLHTT